MEFWKLFVVALMPTVKVLLMTVLGTFLALDRFDILRKESSRKKLNTIVFFVFSPALVCGRLAETITPQSLLTLWFLPLNVLLTFTIGAALGLLIVKIIRVPHHLRGLILGCCAAGNLGNLPLIILPAVCKQKSKPFGDADICQKNALGYISLSMAIGSICFWTIVYKLVSISSGQISNEVKVDDSMITQENISKDICVNQENISKDICVNQENISKDTSHTNHVKQLEIECTTTSIDKVKVPEKEKIMEHIKVLVEKINLKALLKPETIGAVIGLIIGIVPIFRKLMIVNNAPLAVIEDTIVMVGDAAIPIMTLLVGANLVKGLKGPGKQFPVIVGIIVARFIALPLIGIGIVKGAIHFGLIHPDPLYQFVLLLQFALPPAVSMSTITQLFGVSEGECSVIMLATYSCAAFSLTLWSTFFMWLVL